MTRCGAFSLSNSETDDEDVDALVFSGVCVRSVASLTLLVPVWRAILAFLERLIEHVAALALAGVSCQVACSHAQILECLGTRLQAKFFIYYARLMLNAGKDLLFPILCQHVLPRHRGRCAG